MMRRVTSGPNPRERVASYMPRSPSPSSAQAVAHAVEAREVGRRLGGRHDVVHGNGERGVRQRDVADLGALLAQQRQGALAALAHGRREVVGKVFARLADDHAVETGPGRGARYSGTGRSAEVASRTSRPAMTPRASAASSTEAPNTPIWSSDEAKATRPYRLTRPYVGLTPTTPQSAAGCRTEPPVSEPRATRTMPAATAAADPPDEPPGTRSGATGLRVGP